MLAGPPVSCGRSPATDTGAPSRERELLKKLSMGLTASVSRSALVSGAFPNNSESPVESGSPSKVITPSLASKPAAGTKKPESVAF